MPRTSAAPLIRRCIGVFLLLLAAAAVPARAATTALWYQAAAPTNFLPDTSAHLVTGSGVAFSAGASFVSMYGVSGDVSARMEAPAGANLQLGAYEGAMPIPANRSPGLAVQGTFGNTCASTGGRFVVLEQSFDAAGNLATFAADFERDCTTGGPVFGEMRIRSSIPFTVDKPANSTVPDAFAFASQPVVAPSSQILSNTITVYGINAPAAISVTGAEYSVNGGPFTAADGTVMNRDHVQLRMTSGAAPGQAVTSVLAIGGQQSAWTVTTWDSTQPLTGFELRQPSTGGVIASTDSTVVQNISVTPTQIWVRLADPALGSCDLFVSPALGGTLVPGAYENAARNPFKGSSPGVDLTCNGAGYDYEWGRFVILELPAASDATPRLAIDVERRGEVTGSPVYLEVRYNSSVPLSRLKPDSDTVADPFALVGGEVVRARSSVVSNAISVLGVKAPIPVSITGGEYSVNGGPYTVTPGTVAFGDEIKVRATAPRPGAVSSAVLDLGGRTASFDLHAYRRGMTVTGLWFSSPPGDYVGQGQTQFLPSPTFSRVRVDNPNAPSFVIDTWDGGYWNALLVSGAPRVWTFDNWYAVLYGNSRICTPVSAKITVLESVYNPDGTLGAYAADFEQRCGGIAPPLVGQLRYNSSVPFTNLLYNAPKIDVDGDGLADVLLTDASGAVRLITSSVDQVLIPASANKRLAGTGDFDGDGRTDLLVLNADGSTDLWLMNGASATISTIMPAGTSWRATRLGDFNGDGKTDILWANGIDGSSSIWLMNGAAILQRGLVMPPMTPWIATAVADFNGDGRDDLVWHSSYDGTFSIWLMNGLAPLDRGAVMPAGAPWRIAGVGDFNGDGRADLLWNNVVDNTTSMWLMSGRTVLDRGTVMAANTTWKATVVADFDGDGRSDIAWYNTDGRVGVWLMNGRNVVSRQTETAAGSTSVPARADDWDGDGRSDLFWYVPLDGAPPPLWLMNGLAATVGAVGNAGWRIYGN